MGHPSTTFAAMSILTQHKSQQNFPYPSNLETTQVAENAQKGAPWRPWRWRGSGRSRAVSKDVWFCNLPTGLKIEQHISCHLKNRAWKTTFLFKIVPFQGTFVHFRGTVPPINNPSLQKRESRSTRHCMKEGRIKPHNFEKKTQFFTWKTCSSQSFCLCRGEK